MKAYKLMWFADRYHLRQYGRTITNEQYCDLPFGVVPSNAKNVLDGSHILSNKDKSVFDNYLKIEDANHYSSLQKPDADVFSESDIEALNKVWDSFGQFDQFQLSELSHQFPEWKRYEERLKDANSPNSFKVRMDDFFVNVKEGSGLFMDDDKLLELTKSVFHSYNGCC